MKYIDTHTRAPLPTLPHIPEICIGIFDHFCSCHLCHICNHVGGKTGAKPLSGKTHSLGWGSEITFLGGAGLIFDWEADLLRVLNLRFGQQRSRRSTSRKFGTSKIPYPFANPTKMQQLKSNYSSNVHNSRISCTGGLQG